MSQLLRIILIHTHLPGVVEIQLDAHANICGTNGAGKTTLQCLVPVFYGEQPNRVVPRTRKKLDEYYLPYSNSYIVYEYQRESGDICQVVLTRKSDGGIDYRFVSAPYQSDFYLPYAEENVQAFSYSEWAAAMRDRSDVQISPKISATSEYRSIIQNDASALREKNSDSIKLRRLSASYSLASGHHRLRHIEKLVSAVHAKEGKMDTLKAMLAAIFEEDGVTLPTTKVKNQKAREWIQQMRHSLRSDKLQQNFESLKRLGHQLNDAEAQLAALLPLIQDDEQQQKKNKADAEARVYQLRGQLQKLKEKYEEQQLNLNDRLSKTEADIKATVSQLNHLQREYDRYERLNMDRLQHDTNALPVWREGLKELADQYELMMEQHGDLEHQLGQHKAKLEESYTQLSEQNRIKQQELQKQKEHTREQQVSKQTALEQLLREREQALESRFGEQLTECSSAIAVLQEQLKRSQLTDDERDEMYVAESLSSPDIR
ncbi:ATP-binding protein [Xenorhabdus littoralis]|uniref:ATP-binding protein n=1 Tax=Xenorhabdus littoralis TaxID=2582835 RepID=UPI0029E7D364|nr:ATP-binding protein [Xenorhabdus sp. psl]